MLTIRNLTKTYAGRTLFEDVKMTINWGERVALVGPNGAGKSTLIRIILGEEECDAGTAEIDEYAITGYLAQESGDPQEDSILEIAIAINPEMRTAIQTIREGEASGNLNTKEFADAQEVFDSNNGYALEPKAKKILGGLGFTEEQFNKPAHTFSGGWIMRAHLAQLLVKEPDLLILDEPTNHLDLLSLLWFQRYLMNYPGAIFMISHDRDFMNAIVETVYEIDNPDIHQYTGNYSAYEIEREKRYDQKVAEYRNQQKEIDRVQEFITKFRGVGSKASQVQDRLKLIEKLKSKLNKPIAPRKVFKFNFPQPARSNQKLVELTNVTQAYGDRVIYKDLDFEVERGERLALIGPNGAGKSTLLKLLADMLPVEKGDIKLGFATKLGYFSQHRSIAMNDDNTVLEEVMASAKDLREEEARAILGSFLFRRNDIQKRVSVLSGGEKSRLNLVKFLVDPPNFLLMDEPTTHLDIVSIDALVQALKQYEGTLVFVSHNVQFIRDLGDTIVHVNNGKLTRYAGGYDYYMEKSGVLDDRAAITAD